MCVSTADLSLSLSEVLIKRSTRGVFAGTQRRLFGRRSTTKTPPPSSWLFLSVGRNILSCRDVLERRCRSGQSSFFFSRRLLLLSGLKTTGSTTALKRIGCAVFQFRSDDYLFFPFRHGKLFQESGNKTIFSFQNPFFLGAGKLLKERQMISAVEQSH